MNRSLLCLLGLTFAVSAGAQDGQFKEGAEAAAPAPAPSDASNPSAETADHRSAPASDKDAMSLEDKSAATYTRKTLLYFAPATIWDQPGWHVVKWFQHWGPRFPGGAWTLEGMNQLVGQAIGAATRLARFDYVDMPYGVPPNQTNLKAFSDYMKAAKMDKAKAEADFNTRYKEFDIKGRDLERVMKSAYFYQPTLTHAAVKRVLVCDKRVPSDGMKQTVHVREGFSRWRQVQAAQAEKEIAAGIIMGGTELRTPGDTDWMSARAWLAQRRAERAAYKEEMARYKKMGGKGMKKPEQKKRCVKWHPEWKCSLGAKVDFHHLKHQPPYKAHFATLKARSSNQKRQLRNACRGAARGIGGRINQSMRGLEPFRLLAPVRSRVSDRLGFGLGKREGLKVDQGFYLAEYDAKMKRKKIGYSRVRKIADNRPDRSGRRQDVHSEAELIAGRGDLGNQMLEDHRDDGGNFIIAGGTGLTLSAAKSLGFLFNSERLSELWLVLEGGTIATDFDPVVFYALGLKKRWHLRSPAGSVGLGLQVEVSGNVDEEEAYPGVVLSLDQFIFSGVAGIHLRAGVQAGQRNVVGGLIFNF